MRLTRKRQPGEQVPPLLVMALLLASGLVAFVAADVLYARSDLSRLQALSAVFGGLGGMGGVLLGAAAARGRQAEVLARCCGWALLPVWSLAIAGGFAMWLQPWTPTPESSDAEWVVSGATSPLTYGNDTEVLLRDLRDYLPRLASSPGNDGFAIFLHPAARFEHAAEPQPEQRWIITPSTAGQPAGTRARLNLSALSGSLTTVECTVSSRSLLFPIRHVFIHSIRWR
jgi:hypothetical protein